MADRGGWTCSRTTSAALRHDLRGVRRLLDAGADHDIRRAAPVTSSTTTAPKAPTSWVGGTESSSIIVRRNSNPSHLEFAAPYALGSTRAVQTTRHRAPRRAPGHQRRDPDHPGRRRRLPGQVVVAETLNLQVVTGHSVGVGVPAGPRQQVLHPARGIPWPARRSSSSSPAAARPAGPARTPARLLLFYLAKTVLDTSGHRR